MVFTFESDRLWDGLDLYQSGNLLLFFKGLQTVPAVTYRFLSQKHIRRWLPINKRICYVAPLSQNSKQHRLSNLGEESVQQLPNSSISASHWSGPPDQSIHSENCTKLVYCWMLFTCTKLKVKISNKGPNLFYNQLTCGSSVLNDDGQQL